MAPSTSRSEPRAKPPRAESLAKDPRWSALIRRDSSADGRFYYAVKTTGVYCRPSCGARAPRPENVEFFVSSLDAENAGYRACKRCKPGRPSLAVEHATRVADLCRFMQNAERLPSRKELAERAGLSVHHLQRVFKAATGLTPRAYAAAERARRVRTRLQAGASVTEAVYAAGYGSSSRFYESSETTLGMTASSYRAGGVDVRIRFAIGECSLGSILVAASPRGVCAISLGDEPERLIHELEDLFPKAELIGGDAEFDRLVGRVVAFVEAPGAGVDLPLDVRGTAFQLRVWQALRAIPAGATASYTEVAAELGAPSAVRAVANACAQNRLAVVIPCHRVVRTDGALAGYRWGVERKRAMLEREAKQSEPEG